MMFLELTPELPKSSSLRRCNNLQEILMSDGKVIHLDTPELPMPPSPTTSSILLSAMEMKLRFPMANSVTPTLSIFQLFPSLPSEIRQHIFRLSLPARILTLTYDPASNSFFTPTPPPGLLSVSHEARLAAQQVYCHSFATTSSPPTIYFNPYLDTLYLPRHGDMGYDESFRDFKNLVSDDNGRLDELRSVAIDHVQVHVKRPWEGYNKASFLRGFKSLEEIILVTDDDGDSDEEERPGAQPLGFVESRAKPEEQLQMWWFFRQNFMAEEKILADVCAEREVDYEVFNLPTVRIKSKASRESSDSDDEELKTAVRRLVI